jgi:hypothetical protein
VASPDASKASRVRTAESDRRSARIEAHAPAILSLLDEKATSSWPRSRQDWLSKAWLWASAGCGGSSAATR